MWTKKFEDGVLSLWGASRDENEAPSVLQPFNPLTGNEWASEEAAMEWADSIIFSMENPPVVELEPALVEEDPNAIDA